MEQEKNIFDNYVENYQETLGECLKITGYDASYFTLAKIRKLRTLNFKNILEPIRILDFGCGVGNFSVGFKKFFPNSVYVGVDASSGVIREALKKIGQGNHKCIPVVDKNKRLLGTLSDGDLRKAILKGAQLNESIQRFYYQKPFCLKKGEFNKWLGIAY